MDPTDPRSPRVTLGAVGVVILLLVGVSLLPRVLGGNTAAIVGREAPDFTLDLVANGAALGEGKASLSLSDLRGQAVLLDFSATWCEPCRVQAPIMDQVSRRWRDRGVVVLGVDTDAPGEGDPRDFALARHLSYPIVHDGSGEAMRRYNVENLPTVVAISPVGRVVAVHAGITDDAKLERLIRQALSPAGT